MLLSLLKKQEKWDFVKTSTKTIVIAFLVSCKFMIKHKAIALQHSEASHLEVFFKVGVLKSLET